MADIMIVFLFVGAVIFLGFFAELVFKKFNIPDVFLLVLLGLLFGGHGLKYIHPESIQGFAPYFTAFALLFIIFDGSFKIDLITFLRQIGAGTALTLFNYFATAIVVAAIMMVYGLEPMMAAIVGFILSGVSSAFIIPVAQKMNLKSDTFVLLTLESVITDVFCIIFTISTIEIMSLQIFDVRAVFMKLSSLFAVAGFFGMIGGFLWILVINRFFQRKQFYMLTIAYLLMLYSVTEYLGGNGAIASLFFGIVLQNSKRFDSLTKTGAHSSPESQDSSAITVNEKMFYSQITFFLKTFFFVYIGVLIDFSNLWALLLAAIISLCVTGIRLGSRYFTKKLPLYDREAVQCLFARGMAAAVLANIVVQENLPKADFIEAVTVDVIFLTILISSIRVFILKKQHPEISQKGDEESAHAA